MHPPEFFKDIPSLAKNLAQGLTHYSSIILLADENTSPLCLAPLLSQPMSWPVYHIIETEPGEQCKHPDIYMNIARTLLTEGADRSSLLINIGGGSITDLGGFVASTFMRGIPFIHIPTTLLAMTDASIGGKNGIDLDHVKNILGTVALPERILVCPEFLDTLPREHIRFGLAEMLKHALVADAEMWHALKNCDEKDLLYISSFLERSISVKWQITSADPHEKGMRRLLNFGHTVGHAIESVSFSASSPVQHGDAVLAGMLAESQLAHQLELLSADHLQEIRAVLKRLIPSRTAIPPFDAAWEFMSHDKKKRGDTLYFTLLNSPGNGIIDIACDKEKCRQAYEAAFA